MGSRAFRAGPASVLTAAAYHPDREGRGSMTLALILLGVGLLLTVPAVAQETAIDQRIDDTLGDHTKYQAVITALQKAVAANDAAGVAALVRYPIGVKIKGRETVIKSAKSFIQHYDAIMTPEIVKAVTDQRYEDLFVNYQGIMFGDGEVWVNGICRDTECKAFDVKVITIQAVHG